MRAAASVIAVGMVAEACNSKGYISVRAEEFGFFNLLLL